MTMEEASSGNIELKVTINFQEQIKIFGAERGTDSDVLIFKNI